MINVFLLMLVVIGWALTMALVVVVGVGLVGLIYFLLVIMGVFENEENDF